MPVTADFVPMTPTYPVHFPAQLRQHIRAARKKRGLTQAKVAALIGVSQARVAEIEANPGLVSFEQLMQLLSAIGVTLTLSDAVSSPETEDSAIAKDRTSLKEIKHARYTNEPSINKDLGLGTSVEAARMVLDTNRALEQASKLLGPTPGLDAARKALEANSALEQANKVLGPNSRLAAARKALENLDAVRPYRDILGHSKKGDW